MQIMTIEQRKEVQRRYADAIEPWTGKVWKPELTPEQKKAVEDDIEAGRVPF